MPSDKKSISMFAGFFIPMAFIYLFISLSTGLIEDIRNVYLSHLDGGSPLDSAQYIVILLGALIFVFLLIIGRRINLRSICFFVYLLFPVFIGAWTLFFAVFEPSPLILKEWEAIIYAVGTSLWMGGSFFFFWSFANNHFSFKQAGLYYPCFIILSAALNFPLSTYFRGYLIDYLDKFGSAALAVGLNLVLFVLGIVIFALYACIDRLLPRIKHHFDRRVESIDRLFGLDYRIVLGFYTLSLAYLLTMSEMRLLGSGDAQKTAAIAGFAAIPFLILLSAWLFNRRGQGWKTAAYLITGMAAAITLACHIFLPFNDLKTLPYVALSTLAPFALVLKEISLIAVPKTFRFITKTWVDLFFHTGGIFGAKAAAFLFSEAYGALLPAIALAISAILIISTRIVGTRLQKFAP